MTQEEYDSIVDISQPNSNFSLDWSRYSSQEFAQTFLPRIRNNSISQTNLVDGAQLFDRSFSSNETSQTSMENLLSEFPLSFYTFPLDATANQKKNLLIPESNEGILLAGRSLQDELEITVRFGYQIKNKLSNTISSSEFFDIENSSYFLSISEFLAFFNGHDQAGWVRGEA